MDELNALPYLDAIVGEVMRLHPPVPCTMRVAMKDDVLPLSKPVMDRRGVLRDSIRFVRLTSPRPCLIYPPSSIRKGDIVMIPILALNRSRSLWGENAMESV
jgi:cytochrome P450